MKPIIAISSLVVLALVAVPPHAASFSFGAVKSPGAFVSLNPQPIPPKEGYVMLNPRPIPPKESFVMLNPQPIPPGEVNALNPQPIPPKEPLSLR